MYFIMIMIIIHIVIIHIETFIDQLTFYCAMYTEYAQQIWLLKGINNIWKQIMYLFSLVRNAKANWLVTLVQGTYSDNNENERVMKGGKGYFT